MPERSSKTTSLSLLSLFFFFLSPRLLSAIFRRSVPCVWLVMFRPKRLFVVHRFVVVSAGLLLLLLLAYPSNGSWLNISDQPITIRLCAI